jgi:hypothetical protein
MDNIIVDKLPATRFGLSWAITKEINHTKLCVSAINSVFVVSDSVTNREIHSTAQRCTLRLLLCSSHSLVLHFNVLCCILLTYTCTYIWSIYTVVATCNMCLTINLLALELFF